MSKLDTSSTVDEIQAAYASIPEEAKAKFEADGFKLPKAPVTEDGEVDYPEVPLDITKMVSHDLGDLFGRLTSYAVYVQGKLSLAESEVKTLKQSEILTMAKLRQIKEGEITDRTDQAHIDPRYLKISRQLALASCYTDLVNSVAKRCNKDLTLVSREVTRREQEFGHGRRGENIGRSRQILGNKR